MQYTLFPIKFQLFSTKKIRKISRKTYLAGQYGTSHRVGQMPQPARRDIPPGFVLPGKIIRVRVAAQHGNFLHRFSGGKQKIFSIFQSAGHNKICCGNGKIFPEKPVEVIHGYITFPGNHTCGKIRRSKFPVNNAFCFQQQIGRFRPMYTAVQYSA